MRRPLLALAAVAALLLAPAPAHADTGCLDPSVAPTAEQGRAAAPLVDELLRRGGMTAYPARFPAALCTARTTQEATDLVTTWGTSLFQAAVDRAQGRRATADPAPLARADDRPLYWARLRMALDLRQWRPTFALDRAALTRRFEDASRGLVDNEFAAGTGTKKIFVSGFDPFGLDGDLRTANPSGAAALALNGRRVTLRSGGVAEIRTVVLPVRYADFDGGVVERAFGPRLPQVDLISSISQGYPGLFTIEGWAGRGRSADPYPDNERALSGGTYDHPVVAPGMGAGAQFLATTLPAPAMIAAGTGPFPVLLNTPVVEIPAGGTAPVEREDGPTPGSVAVAGGGGGYLSNEVAYRSNRLRIELGRPLLPGGHLHTPVLTGLPDDRAQLTGPDFESAEAAIVAQTTALLVAAA